MSQSAPTTPTDDLVVSAVIAAYDEESTVEEIIRRVAALPFRTEIVVVDDGSRDGTAAVLARLSANGDVPGAARPHPRAQPRQGRRRAHRDRGLAPATSS